MKRSRTSHHSLVSPAHFYTTEDLAAIKDIEDYITNPDFPCVGAKGALAQDNVVFRVYDKLADPKTSMSLHFDVIAYVQSLDLEDPRVQSFVAVFKDPNSFSETQFEQQLWDQLSLLTRESQSLDIAWNENVSADPDSPHFSMSIAGHPFFVVGMHANASRNARRTPYTVLVFNSNLQFDKLRDDGRFEQLKTIIRKRERKINGSINPMLDDHGNSSEARQYSGRKLPEDWKCPFSHNRSEAVAKQSSQPE